MMTQVALSRSCNRPSNFDPTRRAVRHTGIFLCRRSTLSRPISLLCLLDRSSRRSSSGRSLLCQLLWLVLDWGAQRRRVAKIIIVAAIVVSDRLIGRGGKLWDRCIARKSSRDRIVGILVTIDGWSRRRSQIVGSSGSRTRRTGRSDFWCSYLVIRVY